MKFDSVAKDLKIVLSHRQTVQRFIRHILNLPATKTNKMMVQRHIGVEACAFMPDVHLSHKTGSTQHAECVIDGVARDHRMPALHHPVKIIGSGMVCCSRQRAVNGRTLRCEPHVMAAKALPDRLDRWNHIYLGMIPKYHTLYLRIKGP